MAIFFDHANNQINSTNSPNITINGVSVGGSSTTEPEPPAAPLVPEFFDNNISIQDANGLPNASASLSLQFNSDGTVTTQQYTGQPSGALIRFIQNAPIDMSTGTADLEIYGSIDVNISSSGSFCFGEGSVNINSNNYSVIADENSGFASASIPTQSLTYPINVSINVNGQSDSFDPFTDGNVDVSIQLTLTNNVTMSMSSLNLQLYVESMNF